MRTARTARTARARLIALMLTIALPPLAGCGLVRRAQKAAGPPAVARDPIPLHVKNENFLDMNVAVVSQGVSRRIGMVSGNSAANFSIPRTSLSTDEFSILATPIGGSGRALSGSLTVRDGESVDFRIAQVLRQSVAVVR